MPTFVRLLFLGLFAAAAAPALAMDNTPQNRAQEAARYLAAVSPEMIVAGMAQRMALALPEDRREAFAAAVRKNANMAAIDAAAQAGLVKVFTADELRALADFYGSPLGKAATAKMTSYIQEVMPAIAKEVQAAAAKAQQETGQAK